jgi:DNA (cytosine-5)-methyltransferase 1
MNNAHLSAVSLFSSGGIGDLAIRQAGFEILVSNELLEDRHAVFAANYPATTAVTGSIIEQLDNIEREVRRRLGPRELDLLFATPPCQGMSKNGRGKLLSAVRSGARPPLDERNRLIIPTLELACRLRPETLLLENVPEMANTIIADETGALVGILDFVRRRLGGDYDGGAQVVEFADYGVPQCRQRLITVFSRNRRLIEWFGEHGTLMPQNTHSSDGRRGTKRWRTVKETIGALPALDARTTRAATSNIPYHRVPVLDELKYWWVENTKAERSAFDNQCVRCGSQNNPTHTAQRDADGINRSSSTTPLFCVDCKEMLPRPSVERNGRRELMRGYTSAYKRMAFDKPASALTRNLSYACSDNKLHPAQNRVLSLYEAFLLHTIAEYPFAWQRHDGRTPSDKTVREIIGESVPPAGLQVIIDHLVAIKKGTVEAVQPSLFSYAEATQVKTLKGRRAQIA